MFFLFYIVLNRKKWGQTGISVTAVLVTFEHVKVWKDKVSLPWIKNTAPVVNNTLGGTSNHEYQYDDFYRLKSAKATYQGEFTKASYELNMSYNKMHNITKKDLVHTVNNEQKGYVLDYNYDNELHPNAPNKIAEAGKTEPREYAYDGNGNPTGYTEEKSFRKMTWDEENRLSGINDNGRIHQFTYDASGERVIKSSGDSQNVAINGETAATIVHTDDYTGYVSPYFVISKGKFTKHYFEGAGRIVSKLGNGSFAQPLKLTAGGVNYSKLTAEQQKALDNYVRGLGVPPGPPTQQGIYATPEFTGDPYPSEVLKPVEENQEPPEGWPRNPIFNAPGDVPGPPVQFGPPVDPTTVKPGEGFTGIGLPENDIFYFHPDHLGSTSYITTRNGSISQHVEYIAFGGVLFEEHSSSFSSPYLFNGKELDRETNLSYYGARYLDMKTSLWLSVDPLTEKMPNDGAYIFSFNNPVRFIDPDGKEPTPYEAALMASHVYDGKVKLAGGWKVSNVAKGINLSNDNSGFKSAIYERTVKGKKEYTYATAGTEASWKDVGADVKQPLGLSQQYKDSEKTTNLIKQRIGSAEITFTGHSLGGGLAEANAVSTGGRAITFNQAGVSPFTKGRFGLNGAKVDAYITATDPLNILQDIITPLPAASGKRHYLAPKSWSAIYNGHSIDNSIENLQGAKGFFDRTWDMLKEAITPPASLR